VDERRFRRVCAQEAAGTTDPLVARTSIPEFRPLRGAPGAGLCPNEAPGTKVAV